MTASKLFWRCLPVGVLVTCILFFLLWNFTVIGPMILEIHLSGASSSSEDLLTEESTQYLITLESQNPNLDERGEWQKKQMRAFCKKHNLDDQYKFPTTPFMRKRLFRHLIFDDKYKLLFCFIPKIGCTTMRRYLFVLQGLIPKETAQWEEVSEDQYLEPNIYKASFLRDSLTDEKRMEKVKNYYKFMVVRNPLERLVSAFRDKIEKPVTSLYGGNLFEGYKREILRRYRVEEYHHWEQNGGSEPISVTFSEYIWWVVESNPQFLNEHFSPIVDNALPCMMKYDFYANFKLFNSDILGLIWRLKLPLEYFYQKVTHTEGHTQQLLQKYYSQLDRDLKLKLFEKIFQDLDFYYHLYPEEKNSHVELLQVQRTESFL